MALGYIGSIPSPMLQSIVDMRRRLDDLQRQLGSGQKSTNYAGLGLDRGVSVSLRRQIEAAKSFDSTIAVVGVRLSVAQTTLTGIGGVAQTVKSSAQQANFAIDSSGQTGQQKAAANTLDQLIALLNTRAGDRYLFSGQAVDQQSVASADLILNGDATHAGLKQVIDERLQADLGGAGVIGRLDPDLTGTTVSLDEDGVHSFGFKLSAAGSTLSNATLTGPAGSPAGLSLDFTGLPAAGQSITIELTLPDGSTRNVKLTAADNAPPAAGQFMIGATAAATATNFEAALSGALSNLAATELPAASAMAAADNFFADPPQRVDGPPFDTATALIDGTSANTVTWYTGEDGAASARTTASARVDPTMTLNYGMRANEEAFRLTMRSVAVFAAVTNSPTGPDSQDAYRALASRVATSLNGVQGQQKVSDIQAELASVQTAFAAAKDRHAQTSNMLTDLVQHVEGAPQEQVGAEILSLQTSLQASLQTTALLSRISLVNYLST